MSETVNQETGNIETATTEDTAKTFTQDEVDRIVENRLDRLRKNYSDYKELKEKAEKYDTMAEASQEASSELEKLSKELDELKKANEVQSIREKVSIETGVPMKLLTQDTEEACQQQAADIIAFHESKIKYPSLKDGGEVTGITTGSTRDKFAEWANAALN